MAADLKSLKQLHDRLRTELSNWLTLWQEIGDYMVPWRNTIITKITPGTKLTDKIFDATAPQALTTAASAIHSSVTPDNLRWFSFSLDDVTLLRQEGVMAWLDEVANRVFRAITNSNFNSEAQELYSDLLAFGTGLMVAEEEPLHSGLTFTGVRFHTQQPGSFVIAEGADGRVDTIFRTIPMRASALVSRWGLSKVSENTQKLMEQDKPEEMREVVHCVYPRSIATKRYLAPSRRRIASVWAECMTGTGGALHLLEEKGMDEMPVMAPRWRKISGETYGRSPGMLVLPDVRTLNQAVELRLKAWTLAIAPPIVAPDRGVVGQIRLQPFARMYVRPGAEIKALQIPANFDVANFSEDRLQRAIQAGFFVDLLQFQSKQGTPISATEASIRFQTMQKILGPVVSRLQSEFLAPLIQRVLAIMSRAPGALPDIPAALTNTNVSLELIFEGPLSRVQRAANVEAINQFMALLFPVGEVLPDVLTRIDPDEVVEEIAKATAVPANVIRSREAANTIRAAQQEQAAKQTQLNNMLAAAQVMQKGAGATTP
jgi:hypothetical protein